MKVTTKVKPKVKKGQISSSSIKRLQQVRQSILLDELPIGTQVPTKNTYWEELHCIGFNPETSQLEAMISVKRSNGYGSNLCGLGSDEFIRFFIDWDGSGYQDLGITSFKAFDISNAPPGRQHPLEYMVTMSLNDEKKRSFCFDDAVLPKVRAVLSWNRIPSSDPFDTPQFGNALEAHIQLKPVPPTFVSVMDFMNINGKLEDLNLDLNTIIPHKKPFAGITEEQYKMDKAQKVPDHRSLFQAVQPMMINLAGGEVKKLGKLKIQGLEKQKIDVAKVVSKIDKTKANVSYEELTCVGLNTATDKVGAVFQIKKSSGYSGNLCKGGSNEYVSFWADWNNNGTFEEYLGTVMLNVHNISAIPAEGLYYGVTMPVNVSEKLKLCGDPNVIGIRAVLSWNKSPSTTNPNKLETWGNRMDALVQIRPGIKIPTGTPVERVDFIGDIHVDNISSSNYLAYGDLPLRINTHRPWGGSVTFRARIENNGSIGKTYYMIQYREKGTLTWHPIATHLNIQLLKPKTDGSGTSYIDHQTVNTVGAGWFEYKADHDATPMETSYVFDRIGNWQTAGKNGGHELRLIFTKDSSLDPNSNSPFIYGREASKVKTIMVDNDGISVNPDAGLAVDYSFDMDIVIEGGDCKIYEQGEVINGRLRVKDQYFMKYNLNVQPSAHVIGGANPFLDGDEKGFCALPSGEPLTRPVSLNGFDNQSWRLDTQHLEPCGYTVRLKGFKRTIFDSKTSSSDYYRKDKYVGFAVVPSESS